MFSVLIVDHNVTRAGLIGKGIRNLKFGVRINYTLSPVQALFYIAGILSDNSKRLPDIIVVSEPMQQAPTLDTVKSIAESVSAHAVSIVVLSDSPEPRDVTAYYKNGAAAFVAKPSSAPDYLDAIGDTVCFTAMVMRLIPKQARFMPPDQVREPTIGDVLQVYL